MTTNNEISRKSIGVCKERSHDRRQIVIALIMLTKWTYSNDNRKIINESFVKILMDLFLCELIGCNNAKDG